MLPGIAFQTASLAIKVIAPVGSHCTHKPRAFAETSSNHSCFDLGAWVIHKGKLQRHRTGGGGSGRHDDGWMDGLKDFNYNC